MWSFVKHDVVTVAQCQAANQSVRISPSGGSVDAVHRWIHLELY